MAGSGYRTDASARLGERAIVGFSRPSCWASGGSRAIGSERSHVPAQRRRRIASPAAFIDRRIVSATASACAADRYVSCSRIAPAMIRTRSSRVRGGGEPALGIPHGSAIGTKCEHQKSDGHAPAVLQPADRALSLTVNEALSDARYLAMHENDARPPHSSLPPPQIQGRGPGNAQHVRVCLARP